MKYLRVVIIVLLCSFFRFVVNDICISDDTAAKLWEAYKRKYNKQYDDPKEDIDRRSTFEKQLLNIFEHNLFAELGMRNYRTSINEITDWDDNNYNEYLLGVPKRDNPLEGSLVFAPPDNYNMQDILSMVKQSDPNTEGMFYRYTLPNGTKIPIPYQLDWTEIGGVTDVKNQGQCGSCWSFAALGALEAQLFLATGKTIELSEQNLVDCSTENLGCKGGWVDYAYSYIEKYGIDSNYSYPYKAEQGICSASEGTMITGLQGFMPLKSELEIMVAVATRGPVSTSINGRDYSFKFYSDGIYDNDQCDKTDLNHSVLIVGYGTLDGKDYWKIKNCWGKSWGIDGYMWISRNENMCGLASEAIIPVL